MKFSAFRPMYVPLPNRKHRKAKQSDGTEGSSGCAGGWYGYCAALIPPQEIEDCLDEYAIRMFSLPVFDLIPFFSPPLKSSFDGVQNQNIR